MIEEHVEIINTQTYFEVYVIFFVLAFDSMLLNDIDALMQFMV